MDVGINTNDYLPYHFDDIEKIMIERENENVGIV